MSDVRKKRSQMIVGSIVVIAAMIFVNWPMQSYHFVNHYVLGGRSPLAQEYYQKYYTHYYKGYLDRGLEEYEAKYYADYYANFYARYYASDEYQQWANNSLPVYSAAAAAYPSASMVANLKTNATGIELIMYFEGFRAEPYVDAAGKMTIGYGHMIKPGEYFTELDKEEAKKLLQQDVELAEAAIKRHVQVELTPNQFSALVSLVYNIGPTAFKNSTLLKKINSRDFEASALEIVRWTKVNGREFDGLVNRRYSEHVLFKRVG
jgi:lysozyme